MDIFFHVQIFSTWWGEQFFFKYPSDRPSLLWIKANSLRAKQQMCFNVLLNQFPSLMSHHAIACNITVLSTHLGLEIKGGWPMIENSTKSSLTQDLCSQAPGLISVAIRMMGHINTKTYRQKDIVTRPSIWSDDKRP